MKVSSLALLLVGMSTTAFAAGRNQRVQSFTTPSMIRGARILQADANEPSAESVASVSMDDEEEGRVDIPKARECETGEYC